MPTKLCYALKLYWIRPTNVPKEVKLISRYFTTSLTARWLGLPTLRLTQPISAWAWTELSKAIRPGLIEFNLWRAVSVAHLLYNNSLNLGVPTLSFYHKALKALKCYSYKKGFLWNRISDHKSLTSRILTFGLRIYCCPRY